ncbi:MAG: glycosyltransferase family 4 protein [Anaerolineales bacterium]|nr:glycosyltransferase family 4 protein [Anaerolineales bacterium]
MSPSVYNAARSEGVAVVQTLHNYRLVCINAVLYRDGNVCQDCVGKVPWRGVVHRCYRGSYILSLVSASILFFHRIRRTWASRVDAYIALTDFARSIVLRAGLPPENVYIRPNYVYPDPGIGAGERHGRPLFIGRLTKEKGVHQLLDAWSELVNIPLEMIGEMSEDTFPDHFRKMQETGVLCYSGAKPHTEVLEKLKQTPFLVFPSLWYEGLPMTILESFACGTPVIAPSLGVMADLVEEKRTGLHFIPGDTRDLARKVQWAWEHPARMQEMGREARKIYLEKYAAEKNYQRLMEIYRKTIAARAEGW